MKKLHILSAVIPAGIFAIMLGIMGVMPFNPFGDQQIFIVDAWHQYYPFISELWHILRSGDSLLWSWSGGGGHDFLGHIGYYLASPFNFLAVLFPHAWLREVITVAVVVRIGLAGLFMSFYLRYLYRRPDFMMVALSSAYALSAFVISYYWNFMWLDTFAMLPLVALAVHKLVAEGKYKFFVITLALSIIFNFYMGFFICIFVAIYFFVLSISHKPDLRTFFTRLLLVVGSAAITLGLTAFLTLPTYAVLEHTGRTDFVLPGWSFNHGFIDLVGNFVTLNPTGRHTHGGFPNIYAGLLTVMLYPVFLLSRVSLREKIAFSLSAAIILVSTSVPALNFIWHGFSVTHGLPYRYSFLISFLMVVMAWRGYSSMKELGAPRIFGRFPVMPVAMVAGGAGFLTLAFLGVHDNLHVYILIGFAVLYGVFALLAAQKSIKLRFIKILPGIAIGLLLIAELTTATAIGLVQNGHTTGRDNYPLQGEDVQVVLGHRNLPENSFVRTDFTARWSANDPTHNNVHGIGFFSSFANQNTLRFMDGLGLRNWAAGNSYAFAETSPLTGAILNIRYLVNRIGTPADKTVFWSPIAQENAVTLIQNQRHLPLGFMVAPEIMEYAGNGHYPFTSQNDFFRLATGLEGDIFTLLDVVHIGHERVTVTGVGYHRWSFSMYPDATDSIFRFNFHMPRDGEIYAFTRFTNTNDVNVTVGYRTTYNGEEPVRTIATVYNEPHLYRIATFREGDMFTLRVNSETRSGTAITQVGILDRELFETGFEMLASQPWELTSFSATRMEGTVNVHTEGILFTSIPYTGNWRARVNSESVEVFAVDGAMSAIELPVGTHTVEFYYRNNSFTLGGAISLFSLAVFAASFKIKRRF